MVAVFFFSGSVGVAVGLIVALGVSVGDGDDVALSDGDGDAEGEAVGEDVGLGERLRFREGEGDADFSNFSDAVGLALWPAFRLPDALGEGLGVGVFSLLLDDLRCFRDGVGVGVVKMRFIFSPNDSSAPHVSAPQPKSSPTMQRTRRVSFVRNIGRKGSTCVSLVTGSGHEPEPLLLWRRLV